MTKRFVTSVLGTMMVAGCSAGPGADGPEATVQASQALTAVSAGSGVPPVTPGEYLRAADPGKEYPSCELATTASVGVSSPPHFVLRLQDNDGASYGAQFTDGFSIPFPTPWLALGGTCSPPPGRPCIYEDAPYKFEQAVYGNVPGIVHHEFLVFDLSTPSPTAPKGFTVGDHQYFYNGTEDIDALPIMKNIVDTYDAPDAGVAPAALTCIYVMQELPNGTLAYTGYHAKVAQSHDPINWPD